MSQPGAKATPHEERAKRDEVFEFITTTIAPDERSALTEALASDRDLVEKESDPLKFLKCENGNVEAAGKRLVAYWEERKGVFADRFHLPMVITGEGALDADAIAVLSTGYFAFLPDDAKGRSVMYLDYDVDREKGLFGVEKRVERDRVRFYLMHRAAERGRPLVAMRYSRSANMDKVKILAFQRFVSVFPVVLDSIVAVFHAPTGANRVFTDTVIPVMSQYLKNLPDSASFHPIVGSTSQELFSELKKLHFVAKGLPEKLGGTWTWDTFQTWLKARRDIESMGDAKPSAALGGAILSSASMAAAVAAPYASIAAVTTAEDRIRQAEERRNRKRQKDLEYSRERRNREKDEYDLTQLKVDALRRAQAELKEEEARLSSLLLEARDQVDIHLYGKPLGRSEVANSAPSTSTTGESTTESSSEPRPHPASSKKKASVSKDRRRKKSPRRGSSLRTGSASDEPRNAAGEGPKGGAVAIPGANVATLPSLSDMASQDGVPHDMFPLGSLQADRMHAGAGLPQPSNDHLLALLLQQQRSQQAQGMHSFAPQLHPLDQLRLQEQTRGLMLSQLGVVTPSFGVPMYLGGPSHLPRNDPRAFCQEGAAVDRNESADLAALRSMLERRLAPGSSGMSSANSGTSSNTSSLGSQLQMLQLLNRQQQGTYPMQSLNSLSSALGLSYPAASGGSSAGDAAAQGLDALLLQRYRSSRDP